MKPIPVKRRTHEPRFFFCWGQAVPPLFPLFFEGEGNLPNRKVAWLRIATHRQGGDGDAVEGGDAGTVKGKAAGETTRID